MSLYRLLYRSDCALAASSADIAEAVQGIVDRSRTANAAVGLTGALLFSSGVFVQALEGPLQAVEATFERICGDLRHKRVRLLELAVAEDRAFGDWAMVHVTPTHELAHLCPALAVAEIARLDAAAANVAVQLIRTLLTTDSRPAESPRVACAWTPAPAATGKPGATTK